MSNREHTPGPWSQIGNTVYSSDSYDARICDCNDSESNTYSDEAVANASLIAAAPELLESLDRLVFILAGTEGISSMQVEDFLIEPIKDARSAIAKARFENF